MRHVPGLCMDRGSGFPVITLGIHPYMQELYSSRCTTNMGRDSTVTLELAIGGRGALGLI